MIIDNRLKPLYEEALRIRLVEEEIANRYSQQEMRCPTHLSIGQECLAVGICSELKQTDIVFSNHRSHGHYLAKGGSLTAMIAELYGRLTGCCAGRGGSMHMIDMQKGFWGATPIVAGTVPLATGVSFAKKFKQENDVIVIFIGDGCFEEGVLHETMNFAVLKGLSIIFVCENNNYSVYTQLKERQPNRPIHGIAKAHGLNTWNINGNDILEVTDTAKQAISQARQGIPQFIEASTYRYREHCGPNWDDDLNYRPKGELDFWLSKDPINLLEKQLIEENLATSDEILAIKHNIMAEINQAFEDAINAPKPSYEDAITKLYADYNVTEFKLTSINQGSETSYQDALRIALKDSMNEDDSIYVIGEGVPDPKAIFNTTAGLQSEFGVDRVQDMPLAENGMTGICIGSALAGLKPLMIHQRIDFLLLAFDQICNNAAKWHYMFNGENKVPLVIRTIIGRGWGQGPQHSQSLQAIFAHIPGLKVLMPSTPSDAYSMLRTALADPNPVLFIEHRWCHTLKEEITDLDYSIDKARIRHQGNLLTVATFSYATIELLQVAKALSIFGVNIEVIDMRSISPLDDETVIESVKKTGRLLVVDTAWTDFGVNAELVTRVSSKAFSYLKQAPERYGLPNFPVPTSHFMANEFYPTLQNFANKILEMLKNEVQLSSADIDLLNNKLKKSTPLDTPYTDFTGPF